MQLFRPAARYFRDKARAIESADDQTRRVEDRILALGSVLCAVACIESYINAVFIKATEGKGLGSLPSSVYAQLACEWKKSDFGLKDFKGKGPGVLRKYRKAVHVITGSPDPDLGGIYDDASDLVELRNRLVHYKALWPSDLTKDKASYFIGLKSKFSPNPFFPEPQNDFWPKGVLGLGCAMWAVKVSEELVDWFSSLLP